MKGKDQTVGQMISEGRVLRRALKAAKALVASCASIGIEVARKKRRNKTKKKKVKPVEKKVSAKKPAPKEAKAETKPAKKKRTEEEDF